MSHTPCGVDKLLIRPATETPRQASRWCRTYQVKDTKVRVVSGHDTTADANPGGLYKAPLILTEWSVHRFFGSERTETNSTFEGEDAYVRE